MNVVSDPVKSNVMADHNTESGRIRQDRIGGRGNVVL